MSQRAIITHTSALLFHPLPNMWKEQRRSGLSRTEQTFFFFQGSCKQGAKCAVHRRYIDNVSMNGSRLIHWSQGRKKIYICDFDFPPWEHKVHKIKRKICQKMMMMFNSVEWESDKEQWLCLVYITGLVAPQLTSFAFLIQFGESLKLNSKSC